MAVREQQAVPNIQSLPTALTTVTASYDTITQMHDTSIHNHALDHTFQYESLFKLLSGVRGFGVGQRVVRGCIQPVCLFDADARSSSRVAVAPIPLACLGRPTHTRGGADA